MEKHFTKVLVTNDQINKRIVELSKDINNFYKENSNVLIVPILDGSIVFTGQLVPLLDFDLQLKSTRISLYANKTSIDENKIKDLKIDFDTNLIKNKDILIVEDLIDTGNTLNILKNFCMSHGANSVKICILFKKDINPRDVEVDIDWYGFLVPNEWIAGFGVDSKGNYRNFKHLGIVKKEFQ